MGKTLKVIQINIYKGKWLGELVEFLKRENPDIVTMQEVASGNVSFWKDKSVDIFEQIKKETGFGGYWVQDQKFTDSNAKTGNAILTKLKIVAKNHLVLRDNQELSLEQFGDPSNFATIAHYLVDLVVKFGDSEIHSMSSHGVWTAPPTDTEETLRQVTIVADYLKSLNSPFILGTDMNEVIQSKTVGILNAVAKNLMFDSNVLQTTHPKVHKIVPRGFLIDYIFVSPHFEVEKLDVPEVLVSDHLPVVATLRFSPDGRK